MIKFQKVVKVSSKYKYGWHNGQFQNDKTYRVFASTDPRDTYIGKCKTNGATNEKFANTPDHCFIYNDDVNGLECLPKLNKNWYIALASKRLRDKFGIKLAGDVIQLELDFEVPKIKKPRVKKQPEPKRVKTELEENDIF